MTLAILGPTDKIPDPPTPSYVISNMTSMIDALTTKKSNLFHALLKYDIPKAMTLRMASIKKTTVNTLFDLSSRFISN